MDRAWRIGLVAVASVVAAGIGAGMFYIGAAVPERPCGRLSDTEVAASGMSFVSSFSSSQNRVNGILIRAENGLQLECLQVLDRARCETDGPKSVRVISGDLVEYFAIPAGERATLRVAPDGIACGLEAA